MSLTVVSNLRQGVQTRDPLLLQSRPEHVKLLVQPWMVFGHIWATIPHMEWTCWPAEYLSTEKNVGEMSSACFNPPFSRILRALHVPNGGISSSQEIATRRGCLGRSMQLR